ncbi:MAG: 2,4-dihydroxyhept-2-ene-1,7-dioic acid aldolase [Candidatus Omnitrophica bacterium]|nr:2,4-dihydroxyhept-2-ene-1,7-dioic acid aldolase [Candidatus Omnitrophota bacterium]
MTKKGKYLMPAALHLKKNGRLVGSWLTIANAAVVEIMAACGFDWMVVDMEHSPIGIAQAEEMIRIVHLYGLPVLVRVGENSPNLIKRVLDCGASGVVVPMVNSSAEARKAVAAARYPVGGFRGVGLARAQAYGKAFSEYHAWARANVSVVIQVEHIDAVNDLEQIVAVEGLSGVIIGPYDLSASMGHPGKFDHPDVREAFRRIAAVMKGSRIPFGFHVVDPDPGIASRKFAEGYSFLAFGVDFVYLGKSCEEKLAQLRSKVQAR